MTKIYFPARPLNFPESCVAADLKPLHKSTLNTLLSDSSVSPDDIVNEIDSRAEAIVQIIAKAVRGEISNTGLIDALEDEVHFIAERIEDRIRRESSGA